MSERIILVVDDEHGALETLKDILEGLGMVVILATSGRAACALVESGVPISVMILDLRLPDMAGFDVYQRISRHRPGLKVIVVTGYADLVRDFDALRIPCIVKPIDVDLLIAMIETACGR